ncbi:MAG TPA: type II CAAX endopeptidase family protein [Acidimicrobiales bacterium]|nr:type II CAAX endopeptidase family protein [Acidimicrobiales bacterium]
MTKGAAGSENAGAAGVPPPSVLPVDPMPAPWQQGLGHESHAARSPSEGPPPRTTGDAATWLFLAAGGFVVGQILSIVILSGVAALNGHSSDWSVLAARAVPPAWIVVGGLLGLWIGFIGAVLVASVWRGTRSIVADMGLRFGRWDPLIGLGAGLAGQFILLPLLYLPWEHVDPHLSHELQQPAKHLTGGFPGVDLAVIAVLTVVIVPVVEELFFRGLVLRGFIRIFAGAGRILGPLLAVTTTGIVFGLAHAELLELLGLGAFGIVLSVIAYRCKRLGPCIVAHATFNLVAILSIAFPSGIVH